MSIQYIGPASRVLAPSLGTLFHASASFTQRVQPPIVLDFISDEGKDVIRTWYNQQPTTRFTSLEYRKEIGGVFGHEFIAVHLANSAICRFDRWARDDLRGHALKEEDRAKLDRSVLLLSMGFPEGLDLSSILTVCYGAQAHIKAKLYSSMHFNCYFFSWTILSTIGHWASRWEMTVPFEESWGGIQKRALEGISFSSSPRSLRTTGKEELRKLHRCPRTGSLQIDTSDPIRYTMNPDHFEAAFRRQFQAFQPSFTSIVQNTLLVSKFAPELKREIVRTFRLALNESITKTADESATGAALAASTNLGLDKLARLNLRDMIWSVAPAAAAAAAGAMQSKDTRASVSSHIDINSRIEQMNLRYTSRIELAEKQWDRAWSAHATSWRPQHGSAYIPNNAHSCQAPPCTYGKKAWLEVWETMKAWGYNSVDEVANRATQEVVEHLKPVHEPTLTFDDKAEVKYPINPRSKTGKGRMGDNLESTLPSHLQQYIEDRMVAHFEQPENFGAGSTEDLVSQAEESMCQIWESVVDMMPGANILLPV